jgi:hypothetical protein
VAIIAYYSQSFDGYTIPREFTPRLVGVLKTDVKPNIELGTVVTGGKVSINTSLIKDGISLDDINSFKPLYFTSDGDLMLNPFNTNIATTIVDSPIISQENNTKASNIEYGLITAKIAMVCINTEILGSEMVGTLYGSPTQPF